MKNNPEEQTSNRVFRPDIEGFRAVAILMVVIHHIGFSVYGGVDASFVLSGFLATSVLLREVYSSGRIAFGRFYARRARRLLPLAGVVILATLVAVWVWLPSFRWKEAGLDGLSAALSGINWRLAAESTDYFAENAGSSPFQHYWSLAIEEQFYLLWPLLFLAAVWVGHHLRITRWALAFVLVLITGASLFASIVTTTANQPLAYFGLHTRAWEFAIGALVAVAAPLFTRMWQPLAAVMSWAGLAVIGFGSWMVSQSQAIPGSVMLWPVIGTALVMAGGCAAPKFGAELLLALRPVRFVGRMSYGWYLWHWPVLIFAPYALGYTPGLWELISAVLLSLVLAVITYYVVERPIKRNKAFVTNPRTGLALGARWVAASLAAAGVLIASTVAYATPPNPPIKYAEPAQLSQELETATQVTRLTPAIVRGMSTVKQQLYTGCLVDVPARVATACELGDADGEDRIVLIGSSLAWQWIPAFDRVAQQRHARLTVFAKGSCPAEKYSVLVTIGNAKEAVPYPECDVWRADAYRQAAAMRPQMVILTSRVEDQATPDAIAQSVAHFRKLGANVVVVGETPRFHFDVPECLLKHQEQVERCAMQLQDIFPNRQQANMAATVAKGSGATVIDPLRWLCTRTCPPVVDDLVVYSDDHHIAPSFALWLVPLWDAALPTLR